MRCMLTIVYHGIRRNCTADDGGRVALVTACRKTHTLANPPDRRLALRGVARQSRKTINHRAGTQIPFLVSLMCRVNARAVVEDPNFGNDDYAGSDKCDVRLPTGAEAANRVLLLPKPDPSSAMPVEAAATLQTFKLSNLPFGHQLLRRHRVVCFERLVDPGVCWQLFHRIVGLKR